MKTRKKFTGSNRKQRHRRRPDARTKAGAPLSLFQRLTRSWVINALVVPLLISLFGAIVTLLLSRCWR